jgi:predicted RecA/RadA family phage recombinase
MSRTYVQKGNTITFDAPANLSSGDGFVVGSLFAIAEFDALQNDPVEGILVGVHRLPKPNSVVEFNVGEKVFWDASAKQCKKTSAGYWPIGAAVAAAAATEGHVVVRLDGHCLTAA